MRYLNDRGILLPRKQTSGFQQGELLWKKPSQSAIYDILTNPAYTGTFVYGRHAKEPSKRKPGRYSTGVVCKPMEEWQCIIHDVYPAYISWEQYLANQAQMKDNQRRYNELHGSPGVPGKGAALLQGLATCGECGRRMRVAYKPGVRYACTAMPSTFGEPMCAYLDGSSIESWVVKSFFEAIAPAQLDALDELLKQQQKEREQLQKYHQQQIQRAEYEVSLARRRYEKVDPDNRLVADELEREWEERLQQLRETKEAEECFSHQVREPMVTQKLRQQLSHLNRELPQLWETNKLTNEQKKQLLRSLIAKVILKRIAPDRVQVKIVWMSGHFSEGIVIPPIWKQVDVSNYSEILERIQELWKQGRTDKDIANILTKEGFHTARKKTFTSHSVMNIRHQQQWDSLAKTYRCSEKVNGLWTIRGLANNLGVKLYWIYNRIRNGFLSAPDQVLQPQGYYLIRNDEQLMARLRQEVRRTRQSNAKLQSTA